MKRFKHNLSNYRMMTANMGQLIPIGLIEVLAGDTIEHQTSAVIRVSPLNTPVMHPVNIRIHHFFVPHRLSWDRWENFICGDDGGVPFSFPTLTTPAGIKSLPHYLGVAPVSGLEISALPVNAYNRIWNDYFRDQDLESARLQNDMTIANCSWEKDYFTTCRPWTQKGGEVTIPLAGSAPVVPEVADTSYPIFGTTENPATDIRLGYGSSALNLAALGKGGLNNSPNTNLNWYWKDTGLEADLSGVSAIDVNDLRTAFALQRYQEARARYGSRYTEYLRFLGITPSDARLQRAEYLGGGTARLNFSEVLQTTPATAPDEAGVGDLYGHGIGGVRGNSYRKFFEEHGYVVSLMSVRPKTVYMDGTHRTFLKRTKEDFFQKELAFIGQQPVMLDEIYSAPGQEGDVFGYQDRYREYREVPSLVQGEFQTILDAWHLARDLTSAPALNSTFVKCVPSKRINQVETEDNLWCHVNHRVVARRLVPKSAAGRVV